jgi:hypothetical protein
MLFLPGSSHAAAENDVELEAQGLFRFRGFPVEFGDQAIAGVLIGDAIEDGIEGQQRIAGEIHLRDQARGEGGPKHGEVNMRRTPGVMVVFPGVGAGANGDETIAALGIGDGVPAAGEIGIEWSVVLVHFVKVAAGGVGLPDFHEGVGNGAGVLIENAATDDDTLAEWFAVMLTREVEGFAVHVGRAE